MPQRQLYRGRHAAAGAFTAAGDVFGQLLRSKMQQDINNQNATRNDLLERGRTADNLIAQGKLEPEERDAFIKGTYTGPSAEKELNSIIGGVEKAPTMGEVPSRAGLASSFSAARLPVTAFGPSPRTQSEPATPDNGLLPSTAMAPIESQPFQTALNVRQSKLNAFPPEKVGEQWVGDGPNLRPENIYAKWNPDLGDKGSLETMNLTSAGPSAGQKGSFEGQVAAETARQKGPVDTQNAVNTQQALMPGAIQQAAGEAAARGQAETQTAINRAARLGTLMPEQVQPALSLANEFQAQSKDFFVQQDAFRKMAMQAQNPSAAGDLGIIFGYMKMLDPVSSVREGEQATAQNAAGIPDRIRNQWNKLLTGERLAPEQRMDFLSQAKNIYTSAAQEHQQRVQDFTVRASHFSIPTDLVVRQPAPGMDVVGQVRVINGQKMRVVGVDAQGNPQVIPEP